MAEERGLKPLQEILKEFGGWPVVVGDTWDESSFVWTEMIYKFRRVGYSIDYFVDFSVTTDLKNSTTRIIDVMKSFKCCIQVYFIQYSIDIVYSLIKQLWVCPAESTFLKGSKTKTSKLIWTTKSV